MQRQITRHTKKKPKEMKTKRKYLTQMAALPPDPCNFPPPNIGLASWEANSMVTVFEMQPADGGHQPPANLATELGCLPKHTTSLAAKRMKPTFAAGEPE